MKRTLALALALAMTLLLAACGGSPATDPNAGLYEAVSAEMMGITINVADVFENGFSLELKPGGKASFNYDGKSYRMKWTLDGTAFHAEGGGAELDGTLAEGVMLLQNVQGSGVNIKLVCADWTPPAPEAGETKEGAAASADEPILAALATLPVYDGSQAMDMSNWINYGMCLIVDDVFYGRFIVKGEKSVQFVAMGLRNDGAAIRSTAWIMLDPDSFPEKIQRQGTTLFYIRCERGTGRNIGVGRVNVDGSDRRVLYDGDCGYLNLLGDRLYFTNGDGRFVSTDLNGGDLRIELDREVYYSDLLDENWLLFQDDADNESLHLLYRPGEIDLKLNDEPSYNPILCGSRLFYTVKDAATGADKLACIDLAAFEAVYEEERGCKVPVFTAEHSELSFGGEYFVEGALMWPANRFPPKAVEDWKSLEDDAYQNYRVVMRYLSGDYCVEECLDEQLRIDEIVISDRRAGIVSSIPWLR